MRQFGKGEKVRFQKKKVKDGEKEPTRARKRKATESTPAAATLSPAALDRDEKVASGCAACAGRHRTHTCGTEDSSAAQPSSTDMGAEDDSSAAADRGERLGSSYIMVGP